MLILLLWLSVRHAAVEARTAIASHLRDINNLVGRTPLRLDVSNIYENGTYASTCSLLQFAINQIQVIMNKNLKKTPFILFAFSRAVQASVIFQ